VGGRWRLPQRVSGAFDVVSPANREWVLPTVEFSNDDIEIALTEGHRAYRSWRRLSFDQRATYLRRFAAELTKISDRLARVIAVETGKPFDECLSEAALLPAKIEITLSDGLRLIENQKLEGAGEIHFRSQGVLVVLGPFNFPVHLSNGHIIPSLLSGNCCILKPSEKAPYSAQLYLEAAEAAGFPAGVLNLIQGNGEIASRLVRHPLTGGVLATCGLEVGLKILKDTADAPQKIIALEMGGKNAAIVLPDADLKVTADAIVRSAFLSTGQRCTALSRVYVVGGQVRELADLVHSLAKKLVIAHPFETDPKPFMGPLISQDSVDKYLRYAELAENSEHTETVMRPKLLEGVTLQNRKPLPQGFYVSPAIHIVNQWNAKSAFQSHEIFGPSVFLAPVKDREEALKAVNSTQYGLAASVFGGDLQGFHDLADEIDCGLVYWNRPTVGASGKLPFGGWKASGNHRPAGLHAILNSVQAQARIS
jgi:succinylglutamic semialdehyde dehydrogenase